MAKESSFKNMTLTLLVITMVSSAVLAGAYRLTEDAINKVKIKKVNDGIANVLPEFDNDPSSEVSSKFIDGDSVWIYNATKDGEFVGSAIQTFTNNGFAGRISLMVGFLPDGSINNIEVISHNETPGLGDKIEPKKGTFSLQFKGKNPETMKLTVKKDGGDIDAITASTISSRAFCDAVSRAYTVFREDVMKTLGEWDGASGATSKASQN
ncbi:MAG: RnfABCDGE type electron transport complex subunit G [Prevotellaceae bacterium]|jgi:electron transport complex protein RnfG|nr:RnfABCDGE type electron transport complex subunit G [Prevotellaceae bacterium]